MLPKREHIKKSNNYENLQKEFVKLKALYNISKKTNLFNVPKLLDFCNNTIRMERINRAVELRWYLIWNNNLFHQNRLKLTTIFERLGKALAVIHSRLVLPNKEEIIVPKGYSESEFCFLYGDLGLSNVLIKGKDIWLVDPSTSSYQPYVFAYGPFYYDLAQLIEYMKVLIPLPGLMLYKRTNTLCFEKAFLEGYKQESGATISEKKLNRMKIFILEQYLKKNPNFFPLKQIWRQILRNELKNIKKQ